MREECHEEIGIQGDDQSRSAVCRVGRDQRRGQGGRVLRSDELRFFHNHGGLQWKGITGGGKYVPLTSGKPIVPGTGQSCSRATGTYELKK